MVVIRILKKLWPVLFLLSGLFLGWSSQDDLFSHYLDALGTLICSAAVLLILVLTMLVRWMIQRKVDKGLKVAASMAGCFVLTPVAFIVANGLMDGRKNDAVIRYVEQAAPVLDQIKAQTGFYPTELPVSRLGTPPELLRCFGEYTSDGKSFRFGYIDEPAGWAGGPGYLIYDSAQRRWIEEH